MLYFILRPTPQLTSTKVGPISLSSKSNALSASDFSSQDIADSFYKEGQGTFQCFIMLDALARTGTHVDCGRLSNSPNCDNGLYPICVCTTKNDCTNCSHEGYQPVFIIHGIYTLEVMNIPDASRPNAIAAQLTVRTSSDTNAAQVTQVETINLPPIDHQKWVMITVSKEGRRIDIYYNNTLVSSSKTQDIISTISNGTPLIVGDPILSGQIGGLTFLPNRQTTDEVSSTYAKATNTRGDPIIFTTTPTSLTYDITTKPSNAFISGLCLDGSCLSFPQIGQPDLSSYPNIFNINTSRSGLPFRTEYA
jgi:hypothetical protein